MGLYLRNDNLSTWEFTLLDNWCRSYTLSVYRRRDRNLIIDRYMDNGS